jgi:hypothetical protein
MIQYEKYDQKCLYRCVKLLDYNSVACYLFRPPIVAIYRRCFSNDVLQGEPKSIYKYMILGIIYKLCIENQHCAPGFLNIFITNAAPTCFGTYVPSSGSVKYRKGGVTHT